MQILNPLNSSLFLPLSGTFAGILAVALIGVLWGMAVSKDATLKQQLMQRWLSWTCIAVVCVFALLAGNFVFSILAAIVSLLCTNEFCKMSKRSPLEHLVLMLAAVFTPLLAALAPMPCLYFVLVSAVLLGVLSLFDSKVHGRDLLSVLALAYVPILASHAVLLFCLSGPALLISIISSSALANVMAFVFGKLLGGPKLAPKVSPNKTWSGVCGAVVGAYLGFSLLRWSTHLELSTLLSLVLPMVVAIAGILGDLFESMLKRSFQVKDAGAWLPGFGGALDRVDGLLFILPCVYYLVLRTV